jgi:DNA-binding NtrC family response regulator
MTSLSHATLLVLGDTMPSRRQLRDALVAGGATVMVASTMAEAAKCLQSATTLHAVVIDIEDAAAARRALDQLRCFQPGIGVLTVGHSIAEDTTIVSVHRPTTTEALHDAVQRLLANRDNA